MKYLNKAIWVQDNASAIQWKELDMNLPKTQQLVLYRDLLNDPVIELACELWHYQKANQYSQIENYYFHLQSLLLKQKSVMGWKMYVGEWIASSENMFSLLSEKGIEEQSVLELAENDMKILQQIYHYDWSIIEKKLSIKSSILNQSNALDKEVCDILETKTGMEAVKSLKLYYEKKGCGDFRKYAAFKWHSSMGLTGIEAYDSIGFGDLTGYDLQKKTLCENTEFFINGLKANNVLLYGDKGTGKSSSVKALLNEYKEKKLRMIEITKEQFYHFPDIINIVKDRGYKFIVYIDDLSFEEFETEYKHFKAILEGGLETKPQNVVVYVTSNRRNIIKETWKDQMEASNDMHISDSMQEKISLADRFGITLTYPSPDKNLYLRMVRDLAVKEKFDVSEEFLFQEALKWEMRYHGRSGRSARQFMDYMISKQNETILE